MSRNRASLHLRSTQTRMTALGIFRQGKENVWWWWCYHSLTAHQHQKDHTVPKQEIMIAKSIQVATV